MSALFKKNSAIDRKRKKIQKELSSVHSNIKSLSKAVDGKASVPNASSSNVAAGRKRVDLTGAVHREKSDVSDMPLDKQEPRQIFGVHDDKFAGYLASNLESMRPLRHVRRIQRNKAIATVIVVLVLVAWLLYRYFSF